MHENALVVRFREIHRDSPDTVAGLEGK